jgi:SnoaL-like domain
VEQRDALADRFFAAAQQGELEPLEALLAEDVELYGDGGGKVPALARVLRGRARVARTLAAWGRQGRKLPGVTQRRVDINGQPGALLYDAEGKVLGALALEIFDGRVQSVRSVVNPDKLRHLGEVADMRAVLRSGDQ